MLVRSGVMSPFFSPRRWRTRRPGRETLSQETGPTAIGTVYEAVLARRELLHPHTFPLGSVPPDWDNLAGRTDSPSALPSQIGTVPHPAFAHSDQSFLRRARKLRCNMPVPFCFSPYSATKTVLLYSCQFRIQNLHLLPFFIHIVKCNVVDAVPLDLLPGHPLTVDQSTVSASSTSKSSFSFS